MLEQRALPTLSCHPTPHPHPPSHAGSSPIGTYFYHRDNDYPDVHVWQGLCAHKSFPRTATGSSEAEASPPSSGQEGKLTQRGPVPGLKPSDQGDSSCSEPPRHSASRSAELVSHQFQYSGAEDLPPNLQMSQPSVSVNITSYPGAPLGVRRPITAIIPIYCLQLPRAVTPASALARVTPALQSV